MKPPQFWDLVSLDAGQISPVPVQDGSTRLVEVYRADMPWSRQPPPGYSWTSDEDMAEVMAATETL